MELTDKQKKLTEKFAWGNDEEGSSIPMDGWEFYSKVQECADAVLVEVIKKLEVSHWNGTSFVFPVPSSIHPLLEQTFDLQWSPESRFGTRELVCGAFGGAANLVYSELEDILDKALISRETPKKEETRRLITSVILADNPECPIMEKEEISKEDRAKIQGNPDAENFPLQVEIEYTEQIREGIWVDKGSNASN